MLKDVRYSRGGEGGGRCCMVRIKYCQWGTIVVLHRKHNREVAMYGDTTHADDNSDVAVQ